MAEDGNFKELPLYEPLKGDKMIYGRDRAIRGQQYVRESGSSSGSDAVCSECGNYHSPYYNCGK